MRRWALLCGFLIGIVGSLWAHYFLLATVEWPRLRSAEPEAARFLGLASTLPFPLGGSLLASALLRLLAVHGLLPRGTPSGVILPPYPFDPTKTQLVIGEVHQQDGTRSDDPG